MSYAVKEVFLTLQGEGANSGRAAVFLRFTGCNLWSGRAQDRTSGKGSCAQWCDTDFLGTDGPDGGRFESAEGLASRVAACWGTRLGRRLVVCTGGEPLLQLDSPLVDELHLNGFEVAVETNGTLLPPDGIDWLCVSPKAGTELVVRRGNELKVVFPQEGLDLESLGRLQFQHFLLQPLDGPGQVNHRDAAVRHCIADPRWRLSLQTHKLVGIR